MPKGRLSCLKERVPVVRKAACAPVVSTETARLTGSRWLDIRRRHLAAEPLCRECSKTNTVRAGDEVDHIVPILDGGHPTADFNLQTLCLVHHKEKTAGELARRSHQGDDLRFARNKELREERIRIARTHKVP